MATASIPLKHLDDITECPICAELFTDTRVLPCIHTYCLKCAITLAKDKQPGDKIPCPVCRKEFAVPEGGIENLPKNLFVEKLLDVKNLSNVLRHEDATCDVCSGSNEEVASEKKRPRDRKAKVYCIDCRKNMCKQCYQCHQQFKLPGTHKLIERSNPLAADDLLLKFPETSCEKHPDKSLEIYCFECKTAVCMMCYIKGHNSHKCSDVKEVADDLATQMAADAEGIAAKIADCKSMLEKIAEEDKKLIQDVKNAEKAVNEKAEQLKKLVDEHREALISKLNEAKTRQLKETETVKKEIERQIVILENFVRYSTELKQKGTACDIAKLADGIRVRGEELLKFDVQIDLPVDYTTTDIKFSATLTDDDIKRVFGEVAITVDIKDYAVDNLVESGKLVHTIPSTGHYVTGLTTLGDELFVARWSNPQIYVYDTSTYAQKRTLQVGSSTNTFRGLAASAVNNCLYVSEMNNSTIYKLSVETNSTAHTWSVASQPYGLSVNSNHNVLVACYGAHKVQEYTTEGGLVMEINLQPQIANPTHVVQLSSDRYGVTHHGAQHRYCVIGSDGTVIKSIGREPGNGNDQMNSPYGFAVSKGHKVILPDFSNSRMLLLDVASHSAKQLPEAFSVGFNAPYCVHLTAACDAVYVGEWSGARVFCFKK